MNQRAQDVQDWSKALVVPALAVGGFLVGRAVLIRLGVIDDPEQAKLAGMFDVLPILSDPNIVERFDVILDVAPSTSTLARHAQWTMSHVDAIERDVKEFVNAKGALGDNEQRAVGAVQRCPNPYALAFFNWILGNDYAYTIAGYGGEFLEDRHKARIARHVMNINGVKPYGLTL